MFSLLENESSLTRVPTPQLSPHICPLPISPHTPPPQYILQLKVLIEASGFVIEKEEWVRCGYAGNVRSLYQMSYRCVLFVARLSTEREPLSLPPPATS